MCVAAVTGLSVQVKGMRSDQWLCLSLCFLVVNLHCPDLVAGMAAKAGRSIEVNENLERVRDVLRSNRKVYLFLCV